MGTLTDPSALQKRHYVSPVLIERGDVATLTQGGSKTFGAGDGFVLVIPNTDTTVPIKDYS